MSLRKLLTCLVLIVLCSLFATIGPIVAEGPQMDPNGLQATGDAGPRMDPNGLRATGEEGPQMDPDG